MGAQDFVRFVELDENGGPIFDADFTYPDPLVNERTATDAQRLAVADFYTRLPPTLTFGQAHALLSYRSYARAVADAVMLQFHENVVNLFARLLACHISNDQMLGRAAIVWSEDCFDNPEDPCPIERAPGFGSAVETLADWIDQVADAGGRFETYC